MARQRANTEPAWRAPADLGLRPPERRVVQMSQYATPDGELCADADMARLSTDLWRHWANISEGGLDSFLLALDFADLKALRPQTVNECLVYFLGGVLVGFRPCYVVLDNVSTDQRVLWVLDRALDTADLVAIVRKAGSRQYDLVGDEKKVNKFRVYWHQLEADGGWVRGPVFEKAKRIPRNTLQAMYLAGLALKDPTDRFYYRTPVS